MIQVRLRVVFVINANLKIHIYNTIIMLVTRPSNINIIIMCIKIFDIYTIDEEIHHQKLCKSFYALKIFIINFIAINKFEDDKNKGYICNYSC